jgi:putative flippase GtrA
MTGFRLAVLYAGFGVVATAANLGVQVVLHGLLPPGQGAGVAYWLALAAGTGAGLVIKYVLDKRWIFADPSAGIASHGRMFSLYTLMGVASTGIFWGTQTAFFLATGSLAMLYLGGALGLAVGYWVKYRLDRRFVFTAGTAA